MRKLALISLGYSAAIFVSQYLLEPGTRLYFAAGFALLAAAGLCLKGSARKRALLLAVSAAIGFLWSWGHYMFYSSVESRAVGVTAEVRVTAIDYTEDRGSYTMTYVRTEGGGVPGVKTLLYDTTGQLQRLSPGDSFTAKLSFVSAEMRGSTATDDYISRGVYLRAYLRSEPQEMTAGRSLRYAPKYIAHYLAEKADECFAEDTAPFLKAILLGDRADFNADRELYNSAAASGLMHAVAVSGMHLSFLLSFLRLFTGRRKRTAAIGIPLIVLYVFVTGAGAPIVRAGVMQTMLLLAPLFRRERDVLTGLGAAMIILLTANPAACVSVSLQLSFASILGIELISEKCYAYIMYGPMKKPGGKRVLGRLCSFAASNISSSIGALVLTLPLTALYFGRVPLYAVLANLLSLWAVSFVFCIGMVLLLLGCAWAPACAVLSFTAEIPARYVLLIMRITAKLPYASIYTSHGLGAIWLICVYAMFLLTWFFRRKEGFRPVLPTCLTVISLCCLVMLCGGGEQAAVLDVGQGLCSVLTSGDTAVVIDCGSSFGGSRAGQACAAYLQAQGQKDVDLLCLTHLHADHCSGVAELFSIMPVKALALPASVDDDDGELDAILACCEKQGTQVVYIEESSVFTCGDVRVDARTFAGFSGENENCAVYLASIGAFDMLVTGDAGLGIERETLRAYSVEKLEVLIAGHHGSASSSGGELLSAFTPECAIVSVGAGNTYGHPTQEAMERLCTYCEKVYRTDISGDIVMILR